MSWVDQALADIRVAEGCRLTGYPDGGGVPTDGYGNTRGAVIGQIITQEKADADLMTNFAIACEDLDLRAPWWKIAPDPVRRGLVNMCFNMGWPRLSGFENMIAAGVREDYAAMADAALASKWASQVGARAVHIAELFKSAAAGATS